MKSLEPFRHKSSYFKLALSGLLLLLLLACAASPARAQDLSARVSLTSLSPPRVRVEGRRAAATKAWSFRDAYAGAQNLAARIENLSLADEAGAAVPLRRLAPGEFTAERAATRFTYEVKLDPPLIPTHAAHVSWLTHSHGVLMFGDLLPLPAAAASVRFDLPTDWKLISAETKNTEAKDSEITNVDYRLSSAEDAIFFVGRNLRERRAHSSRASELIFAAAGEWAFDDEEAAEAASKVFELYVNFFGGAPEGRALFVLAPFPAGASAQAWSAETRGRTVFLLSGRSPSKVAGLSQLSVPLTHELLHLWVPNALALEGQYDWFYEGFTLYQSVRAGVQLGHLSFQDYLNAVGRAFDNYQAARRGRAELSLVEASRRRWSGAESFVYNKGMLVAFLYDLTLRSQSSNKLSLDTVYRELFRRHRTASAKRDGNESVVEILRDMRGMRDLTERYVVGTTEIDLAAAVAPFGLRVETFGARTRLAVSPSHGRAQRDLLRGLGYNEARGRLR